jgi:hypothetical protein
MEVLLAGAGGCTAYDVVVILKKNGQNVSGCEVKLTAERAATDPKVFIKIHYRFVVRGKNLQTQPGRAGGAPVARKILFGDRHARQDRRHSPGNSRSPKPRRGPCWR